MFYYEFKSNINFYLGGGRGAEESKLISFFFKESKSFFFFCGGGGRGEGWGRDLGWLIGFGFNGPLRQYFSLYRAVSQREGERGKKG